MTYRILLVDDEPLVVEELQESLEFEGFDVIGVNSVAEALAACGKTNFDLIITDLKMPQQGGLDLLRALRDMTDRPQVFVLSGHGAESNRDEATELGALACFAKPVDPDMLVGQIEQALA